MSAWTDFADSIANLGTAGAEAYQTVSGGGSTPPTNPTPATTPPPASTGLPKWAIPAGIGAVLLVILLVLTGRK